MTLVQGRNLFQSRFLFHMDGRKSRRFLISYQQRALVGWSIQANGHFDPEFWVKLRSGQEINTKRSGLVNRW